MLKTYDDLDNTLSKFKSADPQTRAAMMPSVALFAHYVVPASDALLDAMDDPHCEVRAAAATQLGWLYHVASASLGRLIKAVKDPEACVRRRAIMALFYLKPDSQEAVTALIEAMADSEMCADAMSALANIGPPAKAAVPLLLEALSKPDLATRASFALGRIGPDGASAVPSIARLLASPEFCVQKVAVEALDRIGPAAAETVPLLVDALERLRPSDRPSQDGEPHCPAPFRHVHSEHPGQLQVDIALAIWRICRHDLAIPTLRSALREKYTPVRVASLEALAEIGAPAGELAHDLQMLFKDREQSVRCEAVRALAAMASEVPGVVPMLISALKHRDHIVRIVTVRLLDALGPIAAPAVKVLLRLTSKRNRQVRIAAATALWRIARHKAAITTLMQMLDKPGDRFEEAAFVLAQIGPPARRALPVFMRLRASEIISVSRAANYAVLMISGDNPTDDATYNPKQQEG